MLTKEPAYYAVVLMDLEMPVMNGHEATLRLRADSRFRDLPIIAMTAHAARLERERANAEGMSGYIIKPFEPDELLADASALPSPESAAAAVAQKPGEILRRSPVF